MIIFPFFCVSSAVLFLYALIEKYKLNLKKEMESPTSANFLLLQVILDSYSF